MESKIDYTTQPIFIHANLIKAQLANDVASHVPCAKTSAFGCGDMH